MTSRGAIIRTTVMVALLVSSAVGAQEVEGKPAFEFRGHRIGDDAHVRFPYLERGKQQEPMPSCYSQAYSGAPGHYYCEDPELEVVDLDFTQYARKEIGGLPFQRLEYEILDGQLVGVGMTVASHDYLKLRSMLIGKYGEPDSETTETVSNRMGAEFSNVVSVWEFAEGDLVLKQRDGRLSQSGFRFVNPAAGAAIIKRIEERGQDAGKTAF